MAVMVMAVTVVMVALAVMAALVDLVDMEVVTAMAGTHPTADIQFMVMVDRAQLMKSA